MQIKYAAFTYEQILPFLLAILLIFILPMMMRRYGWDWSDLFSRLTGGIWKKDHNAAEEEKRIRVSLLDSFSSRVRLAAYCLAHSRGSMSPHIFLISS